MDNERIRLDAEEFARRYDRARAQVLVALWSDCRCASLPADIRPCEPCWLRDHAA